jgi:rubrerythrin
MDIVKIFEYAYQREVEGKRFFQENAERLSHASAIDAFQKLAEEEQRHIDFIQAQLDILKVGQKPDERIGETLQKSGFFSQRASSEFIEQTVSEAMVPDLPVLRMAYLIERDFAEFYEKSAENVDEDAKKVLLMLARWERGHERFFKELHDRAFERYAEMPWGG